MDTALLQTALVIRYLPGADDRFSVLSEKSSQEGTCLCQSAVEIDRCQYRFEDPGKDSLDRCEPNAFAAMRAP
jgi:hypothetical protein